MAVIHVRLFTASNSIRQKNCGQKSIWRSSNLSNTLKILDFIYLQLSNQWIPYLETCFCRSKHVKNYVIFIFYKHISIIVKHFHISIDTTFLLNKDIKRVYVLKIRGKGPLQISSIQFNKPDLSNLILFSDLYKLTLHNSIKV